MFIKVGINGLGRIGKCVLLQLIEDNEVEIVAINAVNLNVNEMLRFNSEIISKYK